MTKKSLAIPILSLVSLGAMVASLVATNHHTAFTSVSGTYSVAEDSDRTGSPKQSYLITSGAEYIDFMTGFDGGVNNADFARYRNDTFHDEKMRYFGMDYFCDTFKGGGDGWQGTFTSREFSQNGQPYVCFQFGSRSDSLNYCQLQRKDGETWVDLGDPIKNKDTNEPLNCQQLILRVVEIPTDYRNATLRAKFVDGNSDGWGGMTFGAFTGACSLDTAAKLYNLYKLALTDVVLPGSTTTEGKTNALAKAYIENLLNTWPEYADVKVRAATLGEVNNISDDFEYEEGYPTFTEDYFFSDNGGNFHIFSNQQRYNIKATQWGNNMPFNQTNDYFLSSLMNEKGEATREGAKGRFFSSPFILKGSGYISIKMSGRAAKFTVWDADTYEELISVNDDNSNADQRIFVDGGTGVEATCANGSRLCTMTRVLVDCTALLNRKLFVSLEDYRTGGDWGLARFDEFVSYYESTPTISYDTFTQTDGVTGYGVARDILVNGQANDPEQDNHPLTDAWNFLENTYFKLARAYDNTNPASFCSGKDTVDSTIKGTIQTEYNKLTDGAKAIVNSTADYQYSGYGEEGAMYQTQLITTYSVGDALAYMNII